MQLHIIARARELMNTLKRLNEQSDQWLEEHLLVKLLIGLAIGAAIVGALIWFIVGHTHPLDMGGIVYLLISSTIAYTAWAILMFRLNQGFYEDEEEDEDE